MIRSFDIEVGETVNVGDTVQVVDDKATNQFPIVKKGVHLKSPINDVLNPIGANIIGTIDGKTMVINGKTVTLYKYEDNMFNQVDTFDLVTEGKVLSIKQISEHKAIINIALDNEVSCILVHIDDSTSTHKVFDELIVISGSTYDIDIEPINDTLVAVGYLEIISLNWRPLATTLTVTDDGLVKSLRSPLQLSDEGSTTVANMVGITKLTESSFIASHCTIWGEPKNIKHDVVEIEDNDTLIHYPNYTSDSYTDGGSNRGFVKPKYLADGKVLMIKPITTREQKVRDITIEIRKVRKDIVVEDEFVFDLQSSIDIKSEIKSHNVDLLQVNDDESRDYILLNTHLVKVSKDANRLTKVDNFDYFSREFISSERRSRAVSNIMISNGLMAYADKGAIQPYKHSKSDGEFMGVVKGIGREKCSIIITNLVSELQDVSFIAGEYVFYDSMGKLSNDYSGTMIGQATSHNSFIMRPSALNIPTVSRPFTKDEDVDMEGKIVQVNNTTNKVSLLPKKEGYTVLGLYNDGRVHYNGFVAFLSDDIKDGRLYYYNDNGSLVLTPNANGVVGMGINKGIYVMSKAEKESITLPPFKPQKPDNYTMTIEGDEDSIRNGATEIYTCVVKNNNVVVDDLEIEWSVLGTDDLPTTLATLEDMVGNTCTVRAIRTNKQGYVNLTANIVSDSLDVSAVKQLYIKSMLAP